MDFYAELEQELLDQPSEEMQPASINNLVCGSHKPTHEEQKQVYHSPETSKESAIGTVQNCILANREQYRFAESN